MTFDVTTRRIYDNGVWEEWVESVDAVDGPAAPAKVLRRRGVAEWLLQGQRHRFAVTPSS